MMFAQADENLGPVAVSLNCYIQDGLIHLQNKINYKLISEEQALDEVKELQIAILTWSQNNEYMITKEAYKYI